MDAVQPSRIMHGHLHRAYQRSCDFGYGPVQVTGLDADGRLRNFAVLDIADMRWELREGWFGRLRRGLAMLCNRRPPTRNSGRLVPGSGVGKPPQDAPRHTWQIA